MLLAQGLFDLPERRREPAVAWIVPRGAQRFLPEFAGGLLEEVGKSRRPRSVQ